jgi:hypothetical protein
MTDRGIGDNGGPPLQKFTAKHKVDRIREVLEMDITPSQKCVGIGIIVEADGDGIAAELSTKRLLTYASVSDRETVYRATKVLKEQSVAEAIKVKGKPNSYRVLPPKVIESIVDAYNQSKVDYAELASGSPSQPDMGSPVKPDGLGGGHPVGSRPTTPVPSNPTGGSNPVGSEPTSRVEPDQVAPAYLVNKNNKQKQTTTTTVEQDAAGGGGLDFDVLNGSAVDMTAFIAKHATVDPQTARNMLATNIRTFTADAMLEAYSVTIAEMASTVVATPYKYLIGVARRIKDGRAKRAPAATSSEAGESRDEKRSAAVRDAMAKAEQARGMRRNG